MTTWRPDVGPAVARIVDCCLEKEPARRFASVRELSQALSPFASSFHAVVADPVPAYEPSQTPLFDSLSPLQTAPSTAPRRSRAVRSSWPLALALVAVAVLLPRYWQQYSDWGFTTSATRAVFAAPPLLPDEDSAPAPSLIEREPPRLLQYLDWGRAVPEEEAPSAAAARAPRPNQGETWRRAQEVTREHEAENRYGL